ncbi:methyltransferase domain-containing protein [Actinomadura sp. DC4]|uniref:methyltransferase domain-containing protein n=1 Tax=Actinomadura sp. DC4 TaxID=3055069 RepID=UPI0025B1AC83|nr:methyltransferase domain-containing protein [Actinomadura sp. DC4]MDN3357390.1 methyltransferase domain-containing protein [Actinomadura sp. DC4]
MNGPAAAETGRSPLDEVALGSLLAGAAANGNGTVQLVGAHLQDLAARLVADGVTVEATVPGRRWARASRRALRRAGQRSAYVPVVGDIGIDLPFPDSGTDVLVCRLDPQTFPFPRHTVRELGRAITPGGTVVLLAGGQAPWPAGLVDAWAVSAGLAPKVERGVGGAVPFTGSVYESRSA